MRRLEGQLPALPPPPLPLTKGGEPGQQAPLVISKPVMFESRLRNSQNAITKQRGGALSLRKGGRKGGRLWSIHLRSRTSHLADFQKHSCARVGAGAPHGLPVPPGPLCVNRGWRVCSDATSSLPPRPPESSHEHGAGAGPRALPGWGCLAPSSEPQGHCFTLWPTAACQSVSTREHG